MATVPSVVDCLRASPKGQLRYDTTCTRNSLAAMLDDLARTRNSLPASFSPHKRTTCDSTTKEEEKKEMDGDDELANKLDDFEDNTTQPCLSDCHLEEATEAVIMRILNEMEKDRLRKFSATVQRKKLEMDDECSLFKNTADESMKVWMKIREMDALKEQEKRRAQIEERKLKSKQKEEELKQLNESNEKMRELRRQTLEQQSFEKAEEIHQQEKLMDSLLFYQKQLNEKFLQVVGRVHVLKTCHNKSPLPAYIREIIDKQRIIADEMNKLVQREGNRITEADLRIARDLIERVDENVKMMGVEAANAAESKHLLSENISNFSQPKIVSQPQIVSMQESVTEMYNVKETKENQPEGVPPAAFTCSADQFATLQSLRLKYCDAYANLLSDSSLDMKKYKNDLQKAINLTVNTIASKSGKFLQNKLTRLKHVLSGCKVEIGDGKYVSVSEHPEASALCMDLLAKKFVKQGEEQVASNHESAFALANIIIGLWNEVPDFGDLFLAHLQKKCPYAVPYYPRRQDFAQEEQYYHEFGYISNNGVLESQDNFLKRISGMMRLYFAVICSPMPRVWNGPHPHGIENGWKWLTRILNLEPLPSVTATLVFDFIATCGHAMQKNYGKQFHKLLEVLQREFLRDVGGVKNCEGPISRLQTLLHEYAMKRKILPPVGILSEHFWYT